MSLSAWFRRKSVSRGPGVETVLRQAHETRLRDEHPEQFLHETQSPDFVVTTVHGTFARKATWILEESKLAWILRDRLTRPLEIVPFQWSGKNAFAAREQAALDLRVRLQKYLAKWPHACHVIIAHSHGGNVAIRALQEQELSERINGLACLATPFFTASVREFAPSAWRTRCAAAGLAGLGSSIYVTQLLNIAWGWTLMVFVPVAVVIGFKLADIVAEAMHSRAVWVAQLIGKPAIHPKKVTIIRTPGDEAAGILAGSHFVGWALDRAWRFLLRPLRPFRQAENLETSGNSSFGRERPYFLLTIIAAIIPATSVYVIDLDTTATWVRDVGIWLMLAYTAPALLMLASGILVLPLSVFIALGRWPCGREGILAGPFLDLTAEPAPPGTWNIMQISAEEANLEPNPKTGLSHSRAHDDFVVHFRLADWLAELSPLPRK